MSDKIPQRQPEPPVIAGARQALAAVRQRPADSLPLLVLAREDAELRRQLELVLKWHDEEWQDAPEEATLSPADVQTVLAALDIAARWADLTAGPREEHLDGTGGGDAYRALAARLSDTR